MPPPINLRSPEPMLPLPRPPSSFSLPLPLRRLQSSSKWRAAATPSRTQKIMEGIPTMEGVGGAGGAYSYGALKRLDQLWSNICNTSPDGVQKTQVVFTCPGPSSDASLGSSSTVTRTLDVVVCGGTLGIFLATALASKGIRVGIVERNVLKGREQEWNISRKELMEFVHAGILSEEDIQESIVSEFNPNRCGFGDRGEIWVENILNLGVSPTVLLETLKKRFVSMGGIIFEENGLSSIHIYDDAAMLHLADGSILSSQLVIDAMGNFSPVVRQIRSGKKPDGVCLVVGSCCRGFKNNSATSDVIFSSSSEKKVGNFPVQYFWEAFPAGSGSMDRTTYMFTYIQPQPGCPKLEDLLEDYWKLMPKYQDVSLDELEILRVIFGIFPTYRESPLPAAFDRILQVGDASGIQSPVSFGGFGSMTRHIGRLSNVLAGHKLHQNPTSLLSSFLQQLQPNLSASWLFQKAMSASSDSGVSPTFINDLLYANFISMKKLGQPVLQPFLQDVIQFWPLAKTLSLVMIDHPQLLTSIFKQVGFGSILEWLTHFTMLGYFTFLSSFIDPILRPWIETLPKKERHRWRRILEAWKYGSGLDYTLL